MVPLDPVLERTLRRIRKGKEEQTKIKHKSMENVEGFREGEKVDVQSTSGVSVPYLASPMEELERGLRDYALSPVGIPSVIRLPAIQANNFELKPITLQLIQNIQFMGLSNEYPNTNISNLLEVFDTVKYNRVSDDAIFLRLFLFSLKDKVKHWLNSEPPDSNTTWNSWVHKFLSQIFPPKKRKSGKGED